jgi:hypothetical protein
VASSSIVGAAVGPIVAACAFAACIGAAHGRSNESGEAAQNGIAFELRATPYNAGKIARAFLLPEGHDTRLVVRLSGVPPYVGRPVHVYTYIYDAACTNLPPKAMWSLNDRVLATDVAGGRGSTAMLSIAHTLPVPLGDLLAGRYAVAVRTSPADGDRLIFCGEIAHE